MQIETFEVEEIATGESGEHCDEAKQLIEKLQLAGQERFYDAGESHIVCPYRKMTAREALVYGTLLPVHTKIGSYSEAPIPLRILQVASHAVEVIPQGECYIWHARNADVKDPLLISQIGTEYQCERFILGRWGDVLEEFSVLMSHARRMLEAELKKKLAEIDGELAAIRSSMAERIDAALQTGKMENPSFYCH
jgi:hypothetical protein